MHRLVAMTVALLLGCGSSSLPTGDAAADTNATDAANSGDAMADVTTVPADTAVPTDTNVAESGGDVAVDVAPGGEGGVLPDGGGVFPEATLVASPTAYAFSDTTVGNDSAPVKFVATNLSFEPTGPISHVIDGSSSAEFVITGSTCGQPLAYMATCEVTVVFRPVSAGSGKSARLTFAANPGKMFTVLLNGTALSPSNARLTPAVYAFPSVSVPLGPSATSPKMMFTVANNSGSPLGPLAVSLRSALGDDFLIDASACQGMMLPSNATCDVTVYFTPKTVGAKTATLVVAAGAVELTALLSGTGVDAAKLTLTPTSQSFGMVPVGMKSAFAFDVTNTGGATSGKLTLTLEGMNFTEFTTQAGPSCDLPLEPSVSCQIVVTFAPTLAGSKTAALRVAASPGGFAKADLTATAVTSLSQITLTSPSPDPFGTVTVGETSTGFFVVENKGTAATGKTMPSISGSNATEFVVQDNACPDMLQPAQQCGITVRFTPLFVGRRTANLQVDAAPGGFATLPIGGNAIANGQLSITPQSRTFSDRVIGSTSNIQTQSFTIRNLGAGSTGPLAVSIESVAPDQASSFELFGVNDCSNMALTQNRTCRVDVRFLPKVRGFSSANLLVQGTPGGAARASMTGRGCQGSVTNANCQ
jgi:hypothetical protein